MTARATCFGAGTIVNAIATGRGAAFGLALRASAIASERPGGRGVVVGVPPGVDQPLRKDAPVASSIGAAARPGSTSPWTRRFRSPVD